jgi:hypothetical protein
MIMEHRLRPFCALAAVGALLAVPGCGGSDDTKGTATAPATIGAGDVAGYKASAQRIFGTFKTSLQAASAQVQAAKDTTGKLQGLEALRASVNKAADEFSKLEPPAGVKGDNDRLVQEFRRYASHIDTVERALKTGDDSTARAALLSLTQDRADITKTIASIQSKVG